MSNNISVPNYSQSSCTIHLPPFLCPGDHKLIACPVFGDSMEPRIPDGSCIIVDISQDKITSETVYVIMWNGTPFVKLVQWTPQGINLISNNKKYPPMFAKRGTYNVVGKVVAAMTAY